jgi:multiple antibiotic resistance protein
MVEELSRFLVVLFVVVDPPSLAPLFATMTEGASPGYRRRMAIKSSAIACCYPGGVRALGGSAFIGIGISIEAFRIGGGIMLFLIARHGIRARGRTTPAEKAEARRRHLGIPARLPADLGLALATVLLTFGSARRSAAVRRADPA